MSLHERRGAVVSRSSSSSSSSSVSGPPRACNRRTVSSVLAGAGLTITSLTTAALAFTRPGDTPTAARRLEVGVCKGASSATLTIDRIFVQQRRALISVGFNAQSTPLVGADEHVTLARAVRRARTSHT